jgi:hypothetical protein
VDPERRTAALVARVPACARLVAALALLAAACPQAHGQTDVRAWSAAGQVFVVWKVDTELPLTYDVYRSTSSITSTAQGTLAGRVFQPEWSGTRLKIVSGQATWRVPTVSGGTYQLAANEGLFVFTPRAAANEHFAVVRNGSTVITAANRTASSIAVAYDPASQPVSCHLQLAGVTTRGYPFRTYAMWVDGRDDPSDARPDYPVMANAAKHGAPHVFTVYEPKAGLPVGPFPATVCLHGGGPSGTHWSWAPESVHYANDGGDPLGWRPREPLVAVATVGIRVCKRAYRDRPGCPGVQAGLAWNVRHRLIVRATRRSGKSSEGVHRLRMPKPRS